MDSGVLSSTLAAYEPSASSPLYRSGQHGTIPSVRVSTESSPGLGASSETWMEMVPLRGRQDGDDYSDDLDAMSVPSSPLTSTPVMRNVVDLPASSSCASVKRAGRSRHLPRSITVDLDARMRSLEHSRRRQQSQTKWMESKTKMPMYDENGSLNTSFRDNFFALCGLGKETRHQVAMIREVLDSQGRRFEAEVDAAVQMGEEGHAARAMTLTKVSDDYGRTALHFAAVAGRDDVCECLCQYGAVVDARDNRGNSPIDLAATSAHLETVIVLQNNGANLTTDDDEDVEEGENGVKKPKALVLAEMRLKMLLVNIKESRARLVRDAAERRYDGNISSSPRPNSPPPPQGLALTRTRSTADTLNDAQAIVAFLRQFYTGAGSQGLTTDHLFLAPRQCIASPKGQGSRRRTNSVQSIRLESITEESMTSHDDAPAPSTPPPPDDAPSRAVVKTQHVGAPARLDLANLDLLSARLAKIGLDCELSPGDDDVKQAQAAEALEETLGNLTSLLMPWKISSTSS